MKHLSFLFLTALLLACSRPEPQSKTHAPDTVLKEQATPVKPDKVEPADPIASIRQRVEGINTATLEQKHFEFTCDEQMKVDYFYLDGEIAKITVDYGTVGDVYAREDYYYSAGKLIFTYEFVEGGPACEGCIKKNEYRSYISEDRVIRYLKDKTPGKCRTCTFDSKSKQYRLLQAKTPEDMKWILCKLRS
ncbi:hypothetical protein [Pedobacter sp. SYP-B3415]|uniref:hypothetical protein n=1 Tax=Pedobacter sp. SYP-B3415 TaxID=2496641 RepID=UPI00101BC074|nr:hypothetical protein [Pedobacter sp. SYP-B3415]